MQTILLIEDQYDLRENLSEMLEFEGYRVIGVGDGGTGIQRATDEVPSLIVCDFNIPVFDGFDVFKLLRQNLRTMNIPIVFLTGSVDENDRCNFVRENAEAFLLKPCSITNVLDTIKRCLS